MKEQISEARRNLPEPQDLNSVHEYLLQVQNLSSSSSGSSSTEPTPSSSYQGQPEDIQEVPEPLHQAASEEQDVSSQGDQDQSRASEDEGEKSTSPYSTPSPLSSVMAPCLSRKSSSEEDSRPLPSSLSFASPGSSSHEDEDSRLASPSSSFTSTGSSSGPSSPPPPECVNLDQRATQEFRSVGEPISSTPLREPRLQPTREQRTRLIIEILQQCSDHCASSKDYRYESKEFKLTSFYSRVKHMEVFLGAATDLPGDLKAFHEIAIDLLFKIKLWQLILEDQDLAYQATYHLLGKLASGLCHFTMTRDELMFVSKIWNLADTPDDHQGGLTTSYMTDLMISIFVQVTKPWPFFLSTPLKRDRRWRGW